MRKFFLLIPLVCLVGISNVSADTVDDLIREWMHRCEIPGAAIIVLKDDQVIKASNYGFAALAKRTPVTDDTVFEIASMSKMFTAAAVLLLAEEKRIRLDDTIDKYFDDLPAEWSKITVRQLLDHTSGLRDDWDESDEYFQKNVSDSDFLRSLKRAPLKFSPGSRYAYSCGPFLAGMIVSKVSGQSYAEFMRRRLFDPLGMSSTYVNGHGGPGLSRASGYISRNGVTQDGVRISAAAHALGDVGISTTARDLVRWLAAMKDDRLLKANSRNEMFKPARLNDDSAVPSGLGWWLNPIRGYPTRQHGGAFRTGFNSTINWYPESGLAVIILANRFRVGANDMGHLVAGAYDPVYRSLSARRAERDPSPERTLESYQMLLSLQAGKVGLPKVAKGFPYGYYETTDWKQLLEGSEGLTFIACDDTSPRRAILFGERFHKICFYKTKGKNENPVSFFLNRRGKVIYIEPYEY